MARSQAERVKLNQRPLVLDSASTLFRILCSNVLCFFALPDGRCAMKPRDHAAPSPLMTVNELARYLKVSHRTIYRLLRSGHLPILKISDGLYFDRNEINRWIAERQIKS